MLGLRFSLVLSLSVLLPGADRSWVGSQACAPCHAKIYQSYSRTPMAVSSGLAGGGLIEESFDRAEFTHQRSGFHYRVHRDGRKYFFEFDKDEAGRRVHARRRLEYFVGSGVIARAYLLQVDGFLYEAPVAYYAGTGAWDLSPGYDRYDYPFLTRPIVPGCLLCHASRLQPSAGTQNGYASPPFLEGGVGCERCHGPGASHVAKMTSGDTAGGAGIVNPSKLDSERRDSVCAQCHLSGEVRVMRAGRGHQLFVAGEKLSDSVSVFVRAGGAPGMKVTSHVEKLAQSACKRASRERMWCGTCHDPHFVPRPAERAAWFRQKCLGCHESAACRESQAVRRKSEDDCVACHMPASRVTDAEHVVYTDHSIPRRPGPRGEPPPAGAPLVPFGGGPADQRDLGLAYAIAAQRDHNSADQSRAFDLLRAAAPQAQSDSEVLLYLAELYSRSSDERSAIPLYELAMRVDPAQLTASVSLGGIRLEHGQTEEAIRLWRDALSKNPGLVLVRMNLAVALIRVGDVTSAQATLEKALEFSPTFSAAAKLLEQIKQAPAPQ